MKKIMLLFFATMLASCATDIFVELPQGPKGDQGDPGKSAYELWVDQVKQGFAYQWGRGDVWPTDRISIADFYYFLTGEDGDTPYIGRNGNWWVDGEDTHIPATGKDGIDGKDADMPYIKYGNWWVGDTDTGVKAEGIDGKDGEDGENGEDGNTPYIGRNGNWFIDGCDTGKPARGKKGDDGKDGEDGDNGEDGKNGSVITIKDGYWYIDGKNTKVRAFGRDGQDGEDGKNGISAYEQWKRSLPSKIDNTRPDLYNSSFWPINKNSVEDFWDYLSGIDGIDGDDGKDGEDGKDGLSAYDLWLKSGNHGSMKDFLRSLKGRDGEDGKDGLTPFIRNGYWWIGDYNTRIRATGEDGKDGKDGDKGEKGASAYELWKKEVNKGLENTRNDLYDNRYWPKNKTSMDDFWEYLSGMDGINGKDGEDGKDLDKPDAAYLDIPRNIYDLFSVGTGYVSTVSANYPWTYKIITENANIKVDDYFSNIKVVYEQTYNMPDGSTFTTNNGSISLTVKKVPDRDMKFEIRFETHNGDYRWVHESIIITLHAYGTSLTRSNSATDVK